LAEYSELHFLRHTLLFFATAGNCIVTSMEGLIMVMNSIRQNTWPKDLIHSTLLACMVLLKFWSSDRPILRKKLWTTCTK